MAGIKETKENLRKEIRELYSRLASESETTFAESSTTDKLNSFSNIASELAKKTSALAHLLAVEEEKPVVEIQAPVIIPVPELIIPEKETAPPIIFENPVVVPEKKVEVPVVVPEKKIEIPVVPIEKKPEPEIPVVPAQKNYPDIKSFIGFNEKLMFIRLFNGDNAAYEDTILKINSSPTLAIAKTIISNVSATYNWKNDAEPVQIFHSIVTRRFA